MQRERPPPVHPRPPRHGSERQSSVELCRRVRTECVDAARDQFPSEKYLTGLVSKVPGDFCFAFKVTDDITLSGSA
jgi:hypothetical protein